MEELTPEQYYFIIGVMNSIDDFVGHLQFLKYERCRHKHYFFFRKWLREISTREIEALSEDWQCWGVPEFHITKDRVVLEFTFNEVNINGGI